MYDPACGKFRIDSESGLEVTETWGWRKAILLLNEYSVYVWDTKVLEVAGDGRTL